MNKTNKIYDPIVWSNLVFVLIALLSSNPFVIAAGLILTLGSGWMHYDYHEQSREADWFGMYFFPLVIMMWLLSIPYLWLFFLVSAGMIWFYIDNLVGNDGAIGLLMLSATMVKMSMDFWLGVAGIGVFVLFVLINIWERDSKYFNYVHSLKHFVGALGYTILII